MTKRITIISPVLDDWESFARLLSDLSTALEAPSLEVEVIAVDDGSRLPFDLDGISLPEGTNIHRVEVLELALNLGHQRAIAVGLVEVAGRVDTDCVIVMDSDGEDRPSDAAALIAASDARPGQIILAHRSQRSESQIFKIGYFIYKLIYRLLTGHAISFGNFSLLPARAVQRLVYMSELWNSLPSALLCSRIPHSMIKTDRGKRYTGTSKMNLPRLIIHGLSAMSVYIDLIFTRVLVACVGLMAFLVLCAIIAVAMRLFTSLTIPGWTTIIVGVLAVMVMQAVILVIVTTLMVLGGRSARPFIPIIDSKLYIKKRYVRLFSPGAGVGTLQQR